MILKTYSQVLRITTSRYTLQQTQITRWEGTASSTPDKSFPHPLIRDSRVTRGISNLISCIVTVCLDSFLRSQAALQYHTSQSTTGILTTRIPSRGRKIKTNKRSPFNYTYYSDINILFTVKTLLPDWKRLLAITTMSLKTEKKFT